MRIDDWPLERIMRLPDWCFGQRWPVGLYAATDAIGSVWDMAEIPLPDRCVLWEFTCYTSLIMNADTVFKVAIGHQMPTTAVQMNLLEPLMPGVGVQGTSPRPIHGNAYALISVTRLKKVIESAGRKVILQLTLGTALEQDLQVIMVFSSLPREVPDWLISAKAINLP